MSLFECGHILIIHISHRVDENGFAAGQDAHLLQFLYGSLCREIKPADRRDLVPPEFKPHGMVVPKGTEVEDPTPDRKLTYTLDRCHSLIAAIYQMVGKCLGSLFLPNLKFAKREVEDLG